MLLESTRLEDEFYKPLETVIASSNFWTYENSEDDADFNTVFGEDIDQTPAAEVLGEVLSEYFRQIKYPIIFLVRSPDTGVKSNLGYLINPDHKSYPNKIVLGGEMGMSSRGRLMMYLNLAIFGDDFDINDINPSAVASEISAVIRHEVIHAKQYDKRAKSQNITRVGAKKEYEKDGNIVVSKDRKKYLSSPIEIDAYSHEFAEILLRKYGKDKALEILRTANSVEELPIPDQLEEYFKGVSSPKAFKKLMSKVYTHILDLDERKLFESIITRILNM